MSKPTVGDEARRYRRSKCCKAGLTHVCMSTLTIEDTYYRCRQCGEKCEVEEKGFNNERAK